jgi:hypothetical protein
MPLAHWWRITPEDFALHTFRLAAAVLAAILPFTEPSSAKPDVQTSRIQQRSAELSRSYLRTWSSDTRAALADVHRVYAPRVRFYGRVLNRRELAWEKERFIQRWPVRRYSHHPGTMRVACSAASRKCMVRSVINWRTENPARRAVSAGSSRFEQGVAFSPRSSRPLVFHESGALLSRRAKSGRG